MNTVYTLRYANEHFRSKAGAIAFDDGRERPSYRDFAYVAFTIGMTYQVSDTTLRDTRIRRTVLAHAILSYLFGVVIVGRVGRPHFRADPLTAATMHRNPRYPPGQPRADTRPRGGRHRPRAGVCARRHGRPPSPTRSSMPRACA